MPRGPCPPWAGSGRRPGRLAAPGTPRSSRARRRYQQGAPSRCRSPPAGTRHAPGSRRARPTRRTGRRRSTARPARPRHQRSRTGGGSGASARCGRTCRAGSRPAWHHRSRLPGAGPSGGSARGSHPTRGTRRATRTRGPWTVGPAQRVASAVRPPPGAGRGSRRRRPSARRVGSGRTPRLLPTGGAVRRAGPTGAVGTSGTASTTRGPSGCGPPRRPGGSWVRSSRDRSPTHRRARSDRRPERSWAGA